MRRLVILLAAVSLAAACGGGGGGGPIPPGAPGTPTFTNVLSTSLRVNWTAATGAESYKVERAPDVAGAPGTWAQAASGVTALHLDDGGLTASTRYWYRVRGTNSAGDGAYSAPASMTTAAIPPGAPGTPTFTNVLSTSLRVNWTAATGADSYKVERAPDVAGAPGTWAQAASGVTALHLDDGGLTASTSYWYRLRGTNGAGDGAYSAAASVTTAAAGPPLGIWDQTSWDQSLWQ